MLGCNNNDYHRYGMREPENIRAIEQAEQTDGIHLLSPVCPRRITSSRNTCRNNAADREFSSTKERKHPAESTGIRSAPYPAAWQGNTEQCRKLKAARLGIIKVVFHCTGN